MTRKMKLVKQVLMSTLTAVCFTCAFTACSDEFEGNEASNDPATTRAGADQVEAYGLTYETFISESDVQILNADTTEISVSKEYADKLGITSFVNHPMGIWHSKSQLPYIRKATAQKLVGDRYILTVVPSTVAEVIGDKKVNLQTDIYVNNDINPLTRAAGSDIPAYAAKYVDENNVIHPAVIHLTDPYGYDEKVHYGDEAPSAVQTRAAQSGEYQYITAEELAASNTRWTVRKRLLAFDDEVGRKFKLAPKDSKDSVYVEFKSKVDFELNYFLTLEGGLKWSGILPEPYVEKFETGVDGHFNLEAGVEFGFEKEWSTKDKLKFELAKFPGYTYSFFVGPVPVAITVNPNLFIKFDGKISGAVTTGFTYEYGNKFMGGGRYTDGKGWEGIGYFEETKNSFKITPAQFSFTFSSGLGIYLGADIMLYGCAGPELAVGPHLGGKLEVTASPFEAKDWSDILDMKGEIGLDINAVLGAKLSLFGYKLAETELTIPLAGPWVLAKYPSDGTEHKVGDKTGISNLPPAATPWKNFYNKMESSAYGKCYKEFMQSVLSMLKEMYNCNDAEARQMVIERLQREWDSEPEACNVNYEYVIRDLEDYKIELEAQYYDYKYQKAGETGDYEWINAENWKRICAQLKPKFTWYCYGTTPDQGLENIHKWFLMAFHREPNISSAEDMTWISERYRNYPEWEYKYKKQFPTP